MIRLIIALAGACAISYILTPLVRAIAVRRGFVSRSKKEERFRGKVIARLGGIAIFIAFTVTTLAFVPLDKTISGVLIGAFLIFLVGLVDDIIHIKPYSKLIGQIVVACVLVLFGIKMDVNVVGIPLTIFWVVLLTNAFNLLDNMDGLAAGICFIASAFLFIHSALIGNIKVAVLSAALAGSVLGFLRYNFYPAKIYMGDCGSHLLGFLLATSSLLGTWRHSAQIFTMLAIPCLILCVPIFDTAFVTLNRTLNNRKFFHGGIDHTSHRLVIMGLSERKTVLLFYGISIFFGLVGIIGLNLSGIVFLVLILFSIVALVLFGAYLARAKVYQMETVGEKPPKTKTPFVIIDTMLLHKRRMLEVLIDSTLVCACYVAAHILRFEGALTSKLQGLVVQSLPIVIVIKLLTFFTFGLYRGLWRYASVNDMLTIFKATSLGSIFSAIGLLYLWRFEGYSRAVFIIDWLLLFIGICGSRVAERMFQEMINTFGEKKGLELRRVLIFGAGDAGELVLREIKNNKKLNLEPVGFLDDDIEKLGKMIHGVPILGSRRDLASLARANRIDELLIAIASINGDGLKDIDSLCKELNISCRKIEGIFFGASFNS